MRKRAGMRTKGGRQRGSVLEARRKDFDQNHRAYEANTKTKYHRPGSQQDDR